MIVAVIRAQKDVDRPLPGHHANKPIAAAAAVASPPDTPGPRYGTGNRYVRQAEAVRRVLCPGLVGRVERAEGMCFGVLVLGCIACRAAVELAAAEGHMPLIPGDRNGGGHHREYGRPEGGSGYPGRPCRFQEWLGTAVDQLDMASGDLDTSGLGKASHLGRLQHVRRI